MSEVVRIATRKSALALWQAHHVEKLLKDRHPGLQVELLPLSTRGDEILETPLAKIGGKGLFLKELERAMLDGEADIAVHSMKDVPVEMTPGLEITAVLERADPQDAWVSGDKRLLDDLPPGAIVGTSSLRRQCQLLARRPDLVVESLRGNVNTRLDKLDSGNYDAIILAAAGLQRLGFDDRITARLEAPEWVPAPAQGAIGVQTRSDDPAINALIEPLDHQRTRQAVEAERSLSRRLGGSCQLPLAAFAEEHGEDRLRLHALVGSSDGRTIVRAQTGFSIENPESAAAEVADSLLSQGADDIIRAELEIASH
jgi:hydroxymethylbilane synthase